MSERLDKSSRLRATVKRPAGGEGLSPRPFSPARVLSSELTRKIGVFGGLSDLCDSFPWQFGMPGSGRGKTGCGAALLPFKAGIWRALRRGRAPRGRAGRPSSKKARSVAWQGKEAPLMRGTAPPRERRGGPPEFPLVDGPWEGWCGELARQDGLRLRRQGGVAMQLTCSLKTEI